MPAKKKLKTEKKEKKSTMIEDAKPAAKKQEAPKKTPMKNSLTSQKKQPERRLITLMLGLMPTQPMKKMPIKKQTSSRPLVCPRKRRINFYIKFQTLPSMSLRMMPTPQEFQKLSNKS